MRRLIVSFALLASLLPAGAAKAAPFTVVNTNSGGDGSLRAAIAGANSLSGPDTISIDVTGTIELEDALPGIVDDITIFGPGAGSLTVRRKESAAPFTVLQSFGGTTTVSGITVSGGLAATGGGILNGSGSDLTLVRVVVTGNEALAESGNLAGGGGVFNNGSLTVRESSISGNASTARGGEENTAAGGGIENEGSLSVEHSTISGNVVQALAEGGAKAEAVGGGLALVSGSVFIEESTISGNTVMAAEGADFNIARGGGIWGSGLSLIGSTIAANATDTDPSGSIFNDAGGDNLAISFTSTLRNSIVADPQGEGENCATPALSAGFNLDEDGSCELGKGTDLVAVIAGLEPLASNGGPTPTHALRENSPAIDRGESFGSDSDQRGLPRPSDFLTISNTEGGDGADIGAFELQAPRPPGAGAGVVVVSTIPGDRTPPNTRIVRGPSRVTFKREAKFRFASTEAQSSFQCKVDRGKWRGCRNPFKRTVSAGRRHLFKVRAIDRFGNVDPTPARFGWRVKALS
ncbi:MAG TPA: choice-of-anchor Q domain-containing protein [Solirubrobacterales bacterium]|nr:choice-of-anchor Q domain-containing protein [Solirubrobacterales bacterium]